MRWRLRSGPERSGCTSGRSCAGRDHLAHSRGELRYSETRPLARRCRSARGAAACIAPLVRRRHRDHRELEHRPWLGGHRRFRPHAAGSRRTDRAAAPGGRAERTGSAEPFAAPHGIRTAPRRRVDRSALQGDRGDRRRPRLRGVLRAVHAERPAVRVRRGSRQCDPVERAAHGTDGDRAAVRAPAARRDWGDDCRTHDGRIAVADARGLRPPRQYWRRQTRVPRGGVRTHAPGARRW